MSICPHRCCCEDCLIGHGSMTQLDCFWQERFGNWSIVGHSPPPNSHALQESGTSGARAIYGGAGSSLNMVVRFSLDCGSTGKPRVIVNYQDSQNYNYVEFVGNTVNLCTMQGGSPTVQLTKPFSCQELVEYTVCFNEYGTLVFMFSTYVIWACVPVFAQGWRAGVGNGGGGTAAFTSFALEGSTVDSGECPDCLCTCDGHCVPDELKLTIRASGGCGNLNGTEITLHAHVDAQAGIFGGLLWCPSETSPCPDAAWVCHNCVWSFRLFCDAGGCDQWRMWNVNDYPCGLDCAEPDFPYCRPTECRCSADDFYLRFDGFEDNCPYGVDCCCPPSGGTFYVEVTE